MGPVLWSASHHLRSALVGAQVFGKVSQPGCDLTWFLRWEPRRGHQTGLSGGTRDTWILPLTPTQKEQPLFVSQPQTRM